MIDLRKAWGLAVLGALLGLFEAIAIVRYDIVFDDPRPERLGVALLWGAAIVALGGAAFGWGALLTRGRTWLVPVVYLVLVEGTRAWSGDRFEWISLSAVVLAIPAFFAAFRWPVVTGLAAVLLALPGLWGRVPVYTTPAGQQVLFHLPGLVAVLLAGAVALSRRGRQGLLVALGLAVLGGAGLKATGGGSSGGTPDHPNVLFVLVDTLRKDAVSPYATYPEADLGEGWRPLETDGANTPSTARLAREGLTFADAVTVIPKTTQSVAAFQTGRYPIHNGVRVLHDALPQDETTLAELLRAQGYRTGAVVHNGWIMRGRGFEQGFQQFWSYFEIERAWGPLRLTGLVAALDALVTRRVRAFDGNTEAGVATDRAIDWLGENAGKGDPFFLYVHYFDPHWPYRPPGHDGECVVNNIREAKWSRGQMIFRNPLPRAENDIAVQLYEYEVDHNTDQVGRLFDWLDEHGLADDTIVVFTADHGHHLGDHDYWYHHGEFLYEPGVDVPLIVRWPGHLDASSTEWTQFRSIDLFPTLLDLAGIEAPENIDGIPLARLRDEGAPPAFLETDISYFKWNKRRYLKGTTGKLRGVRMGRWKLQYSPKKGQGVWELYDLQNDPGELHNLIGTGEVPADVEARLLATLVSGIPDDEREQLEDLGNRFDRLPGSAEVPAEAQGDEGTSGEDLDPNERAMLEALGYIDDR